MHLLLQGVLGSSVLDTDAATSGTENTYQIQLNLLIDSTIL